MLQCMLVTSIGQNSSVDPSMHCCMSFFFFLMVTIVEVHKLILDVYVSLVSTIEENFVDKLFGKSFILTDCH